MTDKVSVVLPIYNVKDYLGKCIKSILNQTYNNLEVILVDDGSTDGSGELCDIAKEHDKRIKVIHKENGGLSSARNAGYGAATGKYILYIDSDDYVKTDLVKRCVTSIERDKTDIVIYGYNKVDELGNIMETCTWGDKILNHDEIINNLFDGITEMSFGYAWNKLYRKEMLDKSGVCADSSIIDREDLVYNMELLETINSISYIDYAGYFYLQRGNSLLHNSNLARLQGIDNFVIRMKSIDTGNKEVNRKVFNMNVLHYLSDCIIKNIFWNEQLSKKEKDKIMLEIIEKCPFKENLYDDNDNGKHLKMLYKSISRKKTSYFYWYVKLSDMKQRIKNGK